MFWIWFESSHVPRCRKMPEPRSWLVPDRSVMLMTPPLVRPYDASTLDVPILNSSMASTGGAKFQLPVPPPVPALGAPSTRYSLLPVRLPCTDSDPLTSHARVPENPVAPNVVCVKIVPGVSCISM